MNYTSFLKAYLPFYFLGYIFLTFVWASLRVYRQTNKNPITFGSSDNAHDYIGNIMKTLTLLLGVSVALFAYLPNIYSYCMPIRYMEIDYLQLLGFILIHISLVWILLAQFQMGQSWRIGIDNNHITELKTQGLFSYSRNPIFLGMIVSLLGIFCILPNMLTFMIFVSSYWIIQIQVRLEEDFLIKQHSCQYEQYKNKVSRWL
jgi:protein-S-isoprenylcysteine O-methyltransferase Ste14